MFCSSLVDHFGIYRGRGTLINLKAHDKYLFNHKLNILHVISSSLSEISNETFEGYFWVLFKETDV